MKKKKNYSAQISYYKHQYKSRARENSRYAGPRMSYITAIERRPADYGHRQFQMDRMPDRGTLPRPVCGRPSFICIGSFPYACHAMPCAGERKRARENSSSSQRHSQFRLSNVSFFPKQYTYTYGHNEHFLYIT